MNTLLGIMRNGEQLSIFDIADGLGTVACLVIGLLWLRRKLASVQEKLEECEDDREGLHVKCVELETTMAAIQKKMTG